MWYEIFKFELKYRARRPDTYVFFAVLFLFSLIAFDFIYQGENIGQLKENSPYIIARIMSIVSGVFMVITSMIMGVPILRDFEHNMESIMFVNPIKKRDYLLGRFLGSFVVLILIFSALIWGTMLGELMPWRDVENLQSSTFWHYLKPFLTLVLPTLFVGGSIFFISGTLSRKLIVVYTQGILFFVVFILSRNIKNPIIAAILEPFSLNAITNITKSWNLIERNTLSIPIEGLLLYNRLFWIFIAILILIWGYRAFNFNVIKNKVSKKKTNKQKEVQKTDFQAINIPNIDLQTGWKTNFIQLKSHSLFYFKSILKETAFWAIVICGIAIIFINSISLGTSYGVDSYPMTYFIVEELQEMSMYFFLIILIFYSGELIWKERGLRIDGIYDSLPISDFTNLAGKFIGLILTYILLLFTLILSGIAFQTMHGYYNYEFEVYFVGFFFEILPFLVLFTFVSFFIQVLSNSKFVGYILVLLFFLVTVILEVLEVGHPLMRFGSGSMGKYSDMNGYGHFLKPYFYFKIYWFAFGIFLFVLTSILTIRGTETAMKIRLNLSKQRLTKPLVKLSSISLFVVAAMGGSIFFNTNVLNDYWTKSDKQELRAAYEKTLKKTQNTPQPSIVGVNAQVDLYPEERAYTVEGHYVITNREDKPLDTIHIQKWLDSRIEILSIDFEYGAILDDTYKEYGFYTYLLKQKLQPGDSIKMTFKQTFTTQGFVEDGSSTRVIENGIFFGNYQFPNIGYNNKFELRDDKIRKHHGLIPRIDLAKRDDKNYQINENLDTESNRIDFEITIGTTDDQIAIAPGKLQKEWKENGRNYFHYKMNESMTNFYSIVSARYEKKEEKWVSKNDSLTRPVDLEIYYHRGHEYNIDRMMDAMRMSLDYYSQHYSPYQYEQMRIMEFPRYESFAQSFPNSISFSEALGFVLEINEEEDVDIPFYITASGLSHQWWGLQIEAADVEGRYLILESLAQYSALMVMKQKYPEEKIQQFLEQELDAYFKGRISEIKQEVPLSLVEKQRYIYNNKGAINLYAFQDFISEEKVNLALKRFVKDWNVKDGILRKERYPTSSDLLGYFREVTPDSLQYVIHDLFETITLYQNETTEAVYTKLSEEKYKVNLTVKGEKYRVDNSGIETIVEMNDWVDIGIYSLDKNKEPKLIYLKKHRISSGDNSLEVMVDEPPFQAGIDPRGLLIEEERGDNLVEVRN
ncbi:MAG: ABC-2 type transport system permease protein [Saprospiraceae bacterium]|jgi:ABC-2 type transport system permease protein